MPKGVDKNNCAREGGGDRLSGNGVGGDRVGGQEIGGEEVSGQCAGEAGGEGGGNSNNEADRKRLRGGNDNDGFLGDVGNDPLSSNCPPNSHFPTGPKDPGTFGDGDGSLGAGSDGNDINNK